MSDMFNETERSAFNALITNVVLNRNYITFFKEYFKEMLSPNALFKVNIQFYIFIAGRDVAMACCIK